MENPIKMDDLGVPLFWKHPHGGEENDVPFNHQVLPFVTFLLVLLVTFSGVK